MAIGVPWLLSSTHTLSHELAPHGRLHVKRFLPDNLRASAFLRAPATFSPGHSLLLPSFFPSRLLEGACRFLLPSFLRLCSTVTLRSRPL